MLVTSMYAQWLQNAPKKYFLLHAAVRPQNLSFAQDKDTAFTTSFWNPWFKPYPQGTFLLLKYVTGP